jgi:hypothetical protein
MLWQLLTISTITVCECLCIYGRQMAWLQKAVSSITKFVQHIFLWLRIYYTQLQLDTKLVGTYMRFCYQPDKGRFCFKKRVNKSLDWANIKSRLDSRLRDSLSNQHRSTFDRVQKKKSEYHQQKSKVNSVTRF